MEPDDFDRLRQLADLLTPNAIRVAVTLGVPDHLADGPTDLDDLAAATGAHPGALGSLLDQLATKGLVERAGPRAYRLTAFGEVLRHPLARVALDQREVASAMDRGWSGLEHTVRTGEPGYATVHGQGFWDHLAADPDLSASFDRYMVGAGGWMAPAAERPIWPDAGTIVDIAGGAGQLLVEVLRRGPGRRGILVELPGPAERAVRNLETAGVADRVEIVEGSAFDPLPPGGGVYVLGHVLHDWPDAEATTILGRAVEAAGAAGRIVVAEHVVDTDAPTPVQTYMDLLMRNLFGAQERSLPEWERLAGRVGARVIAVHPCDGTRSLLELAPT